MSASQRLTFRPTDRLNRDKLTTDGGDAASIAISRAHTLRKTVPEHARDDPSRQFRSARSQLALRPCCKNSPEDHREHDKESSYPQVDDDVQDATEERPSSSKEHEDQTVLELFRRVTSSILVLVDTESGDAELNSG